MIIMSEQNMIQVKGMDPIRNKITEAGTIPEDWVVNSLGKMLITFPSYGINAPAVKLNTSTPVYIRITDISEDGYFRPSEKVGVDSQLSHLYVLHEGDIVLARTGASVGKSYIYRPEDGHLVYAGFLIKISPNQSILNSNFLFQYMKTQQYWNWIATNSMRSGQPGVNGKEFGSLPVVVPPLKEQTAIANVLSDTDALIIELEQLIAKKQSIKTATVQQLLTGRTRLPQFAKHPDGTTKGYKTSEVGQIPEDWNTVSIYELADKQKAKFDDGDWIESEHITDKGIRLIQTGNIGVGQFLDKESKKYISETSFEQLRCKELQIGDLLICRLAEPAGRACIFPDITESKVITSVDVTIFRPDNNRANRQFLSQYFSSSEWFKNVHEQVGGTTHKRISRGALGKIIVPYPTVKEQTAIATILSDMDAELTALERKLAKIRDIKQGMMQQLLTGRIRLPLDHQP